MTKEEKDLLLKDLCARLPYIPIIQIEEHNWNNIHINAYDTPFRSYYLEPFIIGEIEIKPYLRPMSSMTEEERKEYKHLVAFSGNSYGAADLVDWLNKKMFAYRVINGKDMFELELVLEAPEGMYNI